MNRNRLTMSILLCGFFVASTAWAEVKLPAIISDHMVLQADVEAPIWGWADPGEEVAVAIGDKSVSCTADKDGKWLVRLPKLAAGGPHTLTVKGKNTLAVKDVLVGEVWLGSGQSNMAMVVTQAKNPAAEMAAANLPLVRMFTVASYAADTAQADCEGTWEICSPKTVGRFSATLFFCGREIHSSLGVPVGLIHSSVGGTPIESWISPEVQAKSPELKDFVAATKAGEANFNPALAKAKYEKDLVKWEADAKAAKEAGKPAPQAARSHRPTNAEGKHRRPVQRQDRAAGAVRHPRGGLVPGRGQLVADESSVIQASTAAARDQFARGLGDEFPMAWVQLPNVGGSSRDWPIVREAMLQTLKLPKTGMAITIDIGEENDIHPKNKQDVGKRLALSGAGRSVRQVRPNQRPVAGGARAARQGDRAVVLAYRWRPGRQRWPTARLCDRRRG